MVFPLSSFDSFPNPSRLASFAAHTTDGGIQYNSSDSHPSPYRAELPCRAAILNPSYPKRQANAMPLTQFSLPTAGEPWRVWSARLINARFCGQESIERGGGNAKRQWQGKGTRAAESPGQLWQDEGQHLVRCGRTWASAFCTLF